MKSRRAALNEGVLAYLKESIKGLTDFYPDLIIKEINSEADHIHILISIPPERSVWAVVRIIKASTARDLNKKFPHLKQIYWGTTSIWSAGYFVSTVGINESIIRRYIQNQGKEDSGQTSLELVWITDDTPSVSSWEVHLSILSCCFIVTSPSSRPCMKAF